MVTLTRGLSLADIAAEHSGQLTGLRNTLRIAWLAIRRLLVWKFQFKTQNTLLEAGL